MLTRLHTTSLAARTGIELPLAAFGAAAISLLVQGSTLSALNLHLEAIIDDPLALAQEHDEVLLDARDIEIHDAGVLGSALASIASKQIALDLQEGTRG